MTEQTDKIKICDIIADCFTKEENFNWNGHLVPKLANALIAADIGDVSEYKHRAEVAERAIRIYQTQYGDVRFFNFDVAIKQAEKELKENE